MIVHCNYEELTALKAGGRSLLGGEVGGAYSVLAPSESKARVEALLPRLEGDFRLTSLQEARAVTMAVEVIVEHLRAEMEALVLTTHAAGEEAVSAYFDFAHALTVSHRLHESAVEMAALIELVTGRPPDAQTERTFKFPD